MSTYRTRFSQLPFRHKNESDLPKSAWSQQPNDVAIGLPADEGWGVSQRDRWKVRRKRGEKASARRKAKAAAKKANVTLKSYLRRNPS